MLALTVDIGLGRIVGGLGLRLVARRAESVFQNNSPGIAPRIPPPHKTITSVRVALGIVSS